MRFFGFTLLLWLFAGSISVFGQATSWTGVVSTSWTNAANWTSGVPTSTTDVTIGNGSFTGSFQPTISSNVSIASLTLGLGIATSILTVSRNLTVLGNIQMGSAATLIHQDKSTISLTGNWQSVLGTYIAQSAGNKHPEVLFSGNIQSISDPSTPSFAKLTIAAGSQTSSVYNFSVLQNFVVDGSFDPGTARIDLTGSTFSVSRDAIIRVNAATFLQNYSINPTLDTRSTVEYASASTAQIVAVLSYGNIVFNGASTKTLAGNITTASNPGTNGNASVTAGVLDLGSFSLNRSASGGGTFIVANGATLRIGGTGTFPANFATNTLGNTSLVEYYGANQIVALQTYGNLTISGSGTKSFTAGTVSVNNFINSSTSSIPTGSTIQVRGNWINNGTITPNNFTTSFSGTATQSISGSSITSFFDISVTNTANPGVNVQSNQNLRGRLLLNSNVIFDADGTSNSSVFTLVSSGDAPTVDASIGILPAGAQVLGNVTVQRFMTLEGPSNRIYRYVSSPVQLGRIADLQNEIPITGAFTGSSTCTGCSTTPSMFYYNEPTTVDTNGSGVADLNDGYIAFPVATNSEALAIGRGYAMFVRGNVIGSALWDVRGTVNAGNATALTFPVSYTNSGVSANDGWNLVGNPFPSTIDWNAASGWTKTNITATIYTRDNGSATGQFAVWNGSVGVNGGSRYIAMGQGFWVKANGPAAPILQANENVKAAGTQTTFFRESELTNVLRITLEKGNIKDETVIHFREDASDRFDDYDAIKFPASAVNLTSIIAEGQQLSINSLSSSACSQRVPLSIDNVTPGNYVFSFSDFQSFQKLDNIMLIDNFTGESTLVSEVAYSFAVTANPASYGRDRFVLSFSTTLKNEQLEVSIPDVCLGNEGILKLEKAVSGVSYSAWLNGERISETILAAGNHMELNLNTFNIKSGEHMLTILMENEACGLSAEKQNSLLILERPKLLSVIGGQSCGVGSVKLEAGDPLDQITWYDSNGSQVGAGNVFNTPELSKSTEYFATITNQHGCESDFQKVEAAVVYIDDAFIAEQVDGLYSNFAEGNQWYFEGEILSGQTLAKLLPTKSGKYSLVVNQNGCITTDEMMVSVFKGNEVVVYPNPTSSMVTIEAGELFQSAHTANILNGMGVQVGAVSLKNRSGIVQGNFEMATLPAGFYIFQIIGDNRKVEVKVVKQ